MKIQTSIGIIAVLLAVLITLLPQAAYAFTGDGKGTEAEPYIITTVSQLQEMKDDLTACYVLGRDIDASATSSWNKDPNNPGTYFGFEPIGNRTNQFTGTFDGQGHKITDLYINRPSTEYVGLFGFAKESEIKNVGLEEVDVSGKGLVGGLVGVNDAGTITDSYSTGSVSGSEGGGRRFGWR